MKEKLTKREKGSRLIWMIWNFEDCRVSIHTTSDRTNVRKERWKEQVNFRVKEKRDEGGFFFSFRLCSVFGNYCPSSWSWESEPEG
jgi:IS5 family transposase